jgi:hypothetical protein
MTGKAAMRHLDMIRGRKAKGFAAALQSIRARGFTPTDQVTVLIDVKNERSAHDESVSDATGQMVFWTWDDGTGVNWQGLVYAENFLNGEVLIVDTQVDTSAATFPVLYEDVTYWEPPRPPDVILEPSSTSMRGDVTALHCDGPKEIIKTFTACVLLCCWTMAYGCLFSNVYWPACFIVGCWLVCHSGCALYTIISCS